MKAKLFLMAMAGVALAGCVSEEVADVKQKEQEKALISFEAPVMYNNAESRANVFGEYKGFNYTGTFSGNYSYPRAENFAVYSNEYLGEFQGWDDSKNYWNTTNLIVEYNQVSNGWRNPTELYYWPAGGKKLAFAAYSPADLIPFQSYDQETKTGTPENDFTDIPVVNYGSTGLSITGFKIPDSPDYQYELLYSKRSYNNTANQSGSEYNGAPIVFQHALSAIHFALKKDVNIDVVLKSIEVIGAKAKGNFKENVDESTPTSYSASPTWSNQAEPKNYIAYDHGSIDGIDFPLDVPLHIVELSKDVDGDDCHSLLLLPQMLKNQEVKVKVTYAIEGDEKDPLVIDLGTQIGVDVDKSNEEVEVSAWEPGKKYTYVLRYTTTSAVQDVIYFAPSVSPWSEVKLIYVDLH